MDHVVHINNGSDAARPIILRLLPGEETILMLKVVNHGEPSDITLEASDPVFRAVRFRNPDNHVVKEETIPILARMPANRNRLDGEILLTSNAGESRVPISLLRDAEDSGIEMDDSGPQGDRDLPDRLTEGVSQPDYAKRDGTRGHVVDADDYIDGDVGDDVVDDAGDDVDEYDESLRKITIEEYNEEDEYGGEQSLQDEDGEDKDDYDAIKSLREIDPEEAEPEKKEE